MSEKKTQGGIGEEGPPSSANAAKETRRRVARAQAAAPPALSGKDYALIAAAMIGIGVGLLILFVLLAPKLLPADILNQFFYIVLIVWGLVCALVLFGVLKSYARVTYKHLGGAVELGGPAAFAALVVVGGFWLVPRTDTFTLTLRPHGPGTPVVTSGKIRVEFGSRSPDTSDINSNGEAVIKSIPHKFWGTTVKVLPQVVGYKEEYQSVLIDKDAIDLNLMKAETILKGKIKPPPVAGQVIRILVQDEDGEKTPDSYGRFQFVVHKKLGDSVRVNVCADGRRIYDDVVTLVEDEVAIPTRKPDVSCSSPAPGRR